MRISFHRVAAGLAVLALSACNGAPPDMPAPLTEPRNFEPGTPPGGLPDTSVPAAGAALAGAASGPVSGR